MKTLILILALSSITGCATLTPRERAYCFVPRPGTAAKQSDTIECRMQAVTRSQFMACLDYKGYYEAECYADNGQLVPGQPVK